MGVSITFWQKILAEVGKLEGVAVVMEEGSCEICLADFQVFFSSFYLNPALTLCLAACHRDCFIIPALLFFWNLALCIPRLFPLISP